MSVGRGVWIGAQETLLDREPPAADRSSAASAATSNAELQRTLSTSGQAKAGDGTRATGLSAEQRALDEAAADEAGMGADEVATLGAFGLRPSELNAAAASRMAVGIRRIAALLACEGGDEVGCALAGPGVVEHWTDESVAGDTGQELVVEDAEFTLRLITGTTADGQTVRILTYQDIDGTNVSGVGTGSFEGVPETERAPETEQAPEPEDEEGITSFLEGAFLGDFGDNPTWSALAGQIAIGFVPYAGQAADIRDFVAAGKAVYEGKDNAGWQLALSAIGVLPGFGDAIKAAGKAALGGAAILGTAALKHGDELAELGEGLAKRLGDALPPETLARLGSKLGPEGLNTLARGMDADTLARVADQVDADTLAALVGKGLDGHAIRELADGMSAAELKVLAETGTADEIAAAASRLTKERLSGAAQRLRDEYIGVHKVKPKGGNAAAAELTLDDGTRLSSAATSKDMPMDRPRSASDGPDPVTGKGGHYEPTAHADEAYIRSPDSEYKILSDLTDQLIEAGVSSPKGTLNLYTERLPCDSCLRIIEAFKARFPEMKVNISADFTVKGEPL